MAALFKDRTDAGQKLGTALVSYKNAPNTIVIALPRGGVVLGGVIAGFLHLPLDVVSPRKIGAPGNPEFAIGAITETGIGIFSETILETYHITKEYLDKEIAKEKKEALHRLQIFRGNKPVRQLDGKKVILVDDGVATGSTLFAAIKTISAENPAHLLVAIPVAPVDTIERIKRLVDEVIVLATPTPFFSVGGFYEKFDQTTDEEVIAILNKNI
jgi:putative phosphoribosyl transferase